MEKRCNELLWHPHQTPVSVAKSAGNRQEAPVVRGTGRTLQPEVIMIQNLADFVADVPIFVDTNVC